MFNKLNFKNSGFTLIEVMIVVALIGILAAIAIPSYQDSLRRSRRGDAQGALVSLENFMEQLATETGCYIPGPDRICVPPFAGDNVTPVLPPGLTRSPATGATIYYNLSVAVAPAITQTTYTIQAIPVVGSSQTIDGTMQLDSTGARRWDRNNDNDYLDANELSWN
jgi:type IV pilus assembly protein PilE